MSFGQIRWLTSSAKVIGHIYSSPKNTVVRDYLSKYYVPKWTFDNGHWDKADDAEIV
jgi:hypothetical protein